MKCKHGIPSGMCAVCSGLVRPTTGTTPKRKRQASNPTQLRGMVLPNDSSLLTELGIEVSESQPLEALKTGHVRCSFCSKQVFEKVATHANSQMRKVRKITTHEPPNFDFEDVHFSGRLVACPECVGEIKPIVTGGVFVDGKRIGGDLKSAIRFPEMD